MKMEISRGGEAATRRLATLLELLRRTRSAADLPELYFLAANETHHIAPFVQSAVWSGDEGVVALSGLAVVEENAPYAVWLDGMCRHLAAVDQALPFQAGDLPDRIAAEFDTWLPTHALWAPIPVRGRGPRLALVLARDEPWSEAEVLLLNEWLAGWAYAYEKVRLSARPSLRRRLRAWTRGGAGRQPFLRRRPVQLALVAAALLLFPVRLSVLAPAEVVPRRPAIVRAPTEGVIDAVLVEPNQEVKAGQELFRIETALLAAQRDAALEALAAAEEEYRQASQQAFQDEKARAELAVLAGKLEEQRAQAAFAEEQARRGSVIAPSAGVVIFDDATQLVGRPVATGERVMRISQPDDLEIEAWVGVGDAIPLAQGSPVRLYLDARPLRPVVGELRYFSREPVERPSGAFAYRTRATVSKAAGAEIGLKGTARLQGGWAPAAYWVLRRPLAAIRARLGV